MINSSGLSDARRERLEMLIEEAAEVIKCGTKILRHGYESHNPDRISDGTNRTQLMNELLELWTIMEQMTLGGEIYRLDYNVTVDIWKRKLKYTHHQAKGRDHGKLGIKSPPRHSNAWYSGWDDMFKGKDRNNCGFPRARHDLHREWLEGWDAASAANAERDPSKGSVPLI